MKEKTEEKRREEKKSGERGRGRRVREREYVCGSLFSILRQAACSSALDFASCLHRASRSAGSKRLTTSQVLTFLSIHIALHMFGLYRVPGICLQFFKSPLWTSYSLFFFFFVKL